MTNLLSARNARGAAIATILAVAFVIAVLAPSAVMAGSDWDASTRTQTTSTQSAGDYVYTRLNQNCLNRDGWFWTGQTCLRCTKYASIKCTDENSATPDCPVGFSQFTDPLQASTKYCRRCGTGDYPSAGIKSCRFLTLSTNTATTAYELAFQATECRTGYTLFGGVCYGIPNCDNSYTQYGRCARCVKGYYLTTEGYCDQCSTQAWTALLSPSKMGAVSNQNNGQCVECYGPKQCTTCGIKQGNEDSTYGSYLATNLGRKRYDPNIAKEISQCRACNPGCLCFGPFNLCEQCIDDTWYKNPNENRCYKCDNVCQQDDLEKGAQNHRINCCKNCRWDDKLQKPRCTTCQNFATENGVQSVQVVAWPDTFEVINADNTPYSLCFRCDRTRRSFSGTTNGTNVDPSEDFDLKDNREYKLPPIFGNYFFSGRDNYFLYASLPGDPACTRCQIVTIKRPTISTPGQTSFTAFNDRLALNYIDCLSCQNGYEIMSFNKTNDKPYKFTAIDQDSTNGSTYTWNIETGKSECRPCGYLIQRQDQEQGLSDLSSVAQNSRYIDDRYKYVRRCQRTDAATQNYSITQCGVTAVTSQSASIAVGSKTQYIDYVQDTSQVEEKLKRGPKLDENNPEISESQYSTSKMANYQPNGIFYRYLINDFVSGTTKAKEICVDNKFRCKRIKTPINYTTLTQNATLALKCQSCFEEHIMSTGQHCMVCDPVKEGGVGCTACQADGFPESDGLVCSACSNNRNATSQLVAAFKPESNYLLGADSSNNNRSKCFGCPNGCGQCSFVNGTTTTVCDVCQKWYGFVGSTKECKYCEVRNCARCDGNQQSCTRCDSGYKLAIFNNQTVCERCEDGCQECDPLDRKKCTTCMQSTSPLSRSGKYYMLQNQCLTPYDGCADWDMNGGKCFMCEYGYTLRNGRCYRCFNENSGYIDCANDEKYSTFGDKGTNTRRVQSSPQSRILSLLESEDMF